MTAPRPTFFGRLATGAAHSPWLAVLAVGGAFGLFAAGQAAWPGSEPAAPEVPPVANTAPVPLAPTRLRCETCGIIEAIEPAKAVAGEPAGWIFSVRLPDGSLRRTSDPLRGRWQVGEGMQLIGGDRTWNLP